MATVNGKGTRVYLCDGYWFERAFESEGPITGKRKVKADDRDFIGRT